MKTTMRTRAVIITTILFTAILVTTASTPANAAGPTCNGKQATPGVRKVDVGDSTAWYGTNGNDVIIATGQNRAGIYQHAIFGKGGNDIICIGTGGGQEYGYAHGGYGHDTIYGSRYSDTIIGGPGNDNLRARGGNDWVSGGYGNDWLDGGWGNDTLDGNQGWDVLNGAGSRDTCRNYARHTSCEQR